MEYIQGVIRNLTFYNEDNGYAIVKIHVTDTNIKRGLFDDSIDDSFTVTGYFPKPTKGEEYRFFGDVTFHERYGEQFSAKSYEKTEYINIEGLIDYLASDLFPGVGQKTAERVVETLGEDAINKIIKEPDALDEVPKLSEAQKKALSEGLITHKASEQTLIKLYGYGISSKMAMRIMNVYKEETITKLEANPYRMISDVEGIGFDRADVVARKLGFNEDHPYRINALVVHVFHDEVLQQGHTYIEKDVFVQRAIERLNKDLEAVDEATIHQELNTLIERGVFTDTHNQLSLKRVDQAELDIVDKLSHLTQTTQTIDEQKVYRLIEAFEQTEKIKYTRLQKQAILAALTHQTMILTGGPGTGKTTVIKGLIEVYYHYHGLNKPSQNESSLIHLIAPTGRAAKRMQESTGYYATTIHRFLGYSFDGTFQHNKYNPLEGNLFIVDESSMIDVFLASQLFQSLPDYANLVLVGDDAQLPSVGPGQVLKDLLDSHTLPSVTLEVIHRQAENSRIIDLAQHIRNGQLPEDVFDNYPDRFIFSEHTAHFQPRLKSIVDYMVKEGYTLQDDIQILIPMYRGSVGIHETNNFLQQTYNAQEDHTITHGSRTFKVDDKVLQLTNQIEDNVMNGDQGKVLEIDEESGSMVVEFLDQKVMYKTKDLGNLTHAYAMSIHKSQGSEYPVVILPLFSSYSIMLKRKLIYTAITRAKARLVVFGHIDKLNYAVRNLEESRHTLLKSRLQDTLQPIKKKRVAEPLPLKREKAVEDVPNNHVIYDQSIPFGTLGEELNGRTPYDFMDEE